MADSVLSASQKIYLKSIADALNENGDKKIYTYFFSKQYHHGCGGHPDLEEHKLIAKELTGSIKKLKHW